MTPDPGPLEDDVLEPVHILVVDDQDVAAVWDQRLDDDAVARRAHGDLTRFKRWSQVCRTAEQARSAVGVAVADDVPLGLILIDNKLELRANPHQTGEEALGLMCHIAARYRDNGREPPCCVLATAEPDDLLSYAFMQAGGAHSLDKKIRTQHLLDDLWRVLERGERWRHRPADPPLELTPQQRLVLPYLYAGLPPHEILRRMRLAGELDDDRTVRWVHRRTSEIYEAADEVVDAMPTDPRAEPVRHFEQGEQQRVARFALEHGNIWLDLKYREILAPTDR